MHKCPLVAVSAGKKNKLVKLYILIYKSQPQPKDEKQVTDSGTAEPADKAGLDGTTLVFLADQEIR